MLNRTVTAMETLVDWSGRAVSWLTLLMVLVTFVVVVMRYMFDTGSIALQESVTYMHAMVFLLGTAWTLQQDAHVRVDILYSCFSNTTRAWIDLCGAVFMLMPFMFFLGWISWEYVSESWGVLEGSREAGGLPAVFLLKSLILVMTGLLMLQAAAQALRAIQIILGPESRVH